MKQKRGRKKGSGLLSGIEREEWSDIRNRIIYGSVEWRIVRLRQLILALKREQATAQRNMLVNEQLERLAYLDMLRKKLTRAQMLDWRRAATKRRKALREADGVLAAPLADNYLSARKGLNDKIDALWRDLAAQFERALLNGDADWFTRQARAIKKGGLPQRAQFNAKVVHLFEQAMWGTHAKQGDDREDLTLTPAGKFTDAMASDIYNALEKQSESPLVVELYQFESEERVKEAIHDLAEQLQFALKKQVHRKRRKH